MSLYYTRWTLILVINTPAYITATGSLKVFATMTDTMFSLTANDFYHIVKAWFLR